MGQTALKAKPDDERRSPAQRVADTFGNKRAAQLVDLTTDAIKKWRGRGGGLVPAQYQAIYLAEAERLGLPLTAADLIAEPVE